jgi:hypothetical protein
MNPNKQVLSNYFCYLLHTYNTPQLLPRSDKFIVSVTAVLDKNPSLKPYPELARH